MRHSLLFGLSALLLCSSPAHALSLRVSSGSSTFSCSDGASCDTDPATGVVQATTTLNGAAISINTTGIGFPALGSLSRPDLDDASVIVTGGNGGTFAIAVSQGNFLSAGNSIPFALQAGGTTRGSVSFVAYGGGSEFSLDHQIANLGVFTAGAFSRQTNGSFASDAPYALTVVANVVHPGGSTITSFDADISSPVPEPGTLALVSLGLLGLFVGRRKLT